ncbi:MAG: hypothetical protein IPN38_07365 [Flavobacteriales bacterium]|nr:hypothetical protein [Flavobacteriales bacterium]
MRHFMKSLRADLVSGLLLLLPLTVALFILKRMWRGIHAPVRGLAEKLGVEGVLKVNGLMLLSILVLVLMLVLVGRLVRGRGEGKLRKWAETKVLTHMPGYSYARIILEAKLGLSEPPSIRPALLQVGEGWQPVFYVEPLTDGWCVVYQPSVPLGASGGVLIVEAVKVQVLDGSVERLDHALRRYGKGLGELLTAIPLK